MDKLCNLIIQANQLITDNNLTGLINDLETTINKQQNEIKDLSTKLDDIDHKYLEQINKLTLELEVKANELKLKNEELKDFAKFSLIQKVNKQLEEKNNYIQILESQLDKLKKNQSVVSKQTQNENMSEEHKLSPIIVEEPIKKSIDVPIEEPIKKSKSKQVIEPIEGPIKEELVEEQPKKTKKKNKMIEEFRNDNFNPENFIEINGYELIMYKKQYYLRDLETNQLYDILNNNPNNVVGLYTINGKVKLN